MKRFVKILAITACLIIAVGILTACNPSTAYPGDDWYRPKYSEQMEARDDESGREHINIPDDAKTIEIDGEEYNVMRSDRDFNREKNNILANDIEQTYFNLDGNIFNGNNYKIYGQAGEEDVFYSVRNTVVENVVFSSNMVFNFSGFSGLIRSCDNSIIRNWVNYFSTASLYQSFARGGTVIYKAENCTIENIINYGDMLFGSGICDVASNGTVIKDCVNYGNLSYSKESWYDHNSDDYPIGGIVGRIEGDVQIKNCTNY